MIDFNKFPILYEEETRERVEKFIFENFESTEDGMICHEITSEYVHSDVFNFTSDFFEGSRLYCSSGMGARSQNSLRPGYDHIELMLVGSENLKDDMVVNQQLVALTKYPFANSSWLGPFHTIDVIEPFKEKFGYSYLWFLPEFGEIEVEDSFESYTVKFLPLVPLYEDERNILARMDESSEILQNKLLSMVKEEVSMFQVDNPRFSLASNLEQVQIDIPDELRVAFASDIKDMLQEFIDMGDIDYEDDEEGEDE